MLDNLPLPSLGVSMAVRMLWLGSINRADLLHFSEGRMARERENKNNLRQKQQYIGMITVYIRTTMVWPSNSVSE